MSPYTKAKGKCLVAFARWDIYSDRFGPDSIRTDRELRHYKRWVGIVNEVAQREARSEYAPFAK